MLAGFVQLSCAGAIVSTMAHAQETAGTQPPSEGKCDYSSLKSSDEALRESFEYVEMSPFGSEKNCLNCSYYVQPQVRSCGGCTIVRGEVHPKGWCNEWEKI